jgi:hypothetical protein
MIENFLRRPRGGAEISADALRIVGALSIVAAGVWWQATDAGILALALPALLVPRFLGLRAGFDIGYAVVVLVAAWSNVLDLYTTIPRWDLLLHLLGTGVLTVPAVVALARMRAVPAPRTSATTPVGTVLVATAVGLALSALWEMVEWVGWRFLTDEIFVAYEDSIGDMIAGGTGAALAGILLTRARLVRADAT